MGSDSIIEVSDVTAPRHKWRGFTGSEVLGLDNHRARIVTTADF